MSISYELAKELKEAGFPDMSQLPEERLYECCYEQPTLSELIEACGEDFCYLEKNGESGSNNIWEAVGKYYCCNEHGEGRKFEYGIDPKEAVARLYLALNKK